jgi:hypothetical protein
MRQLSTILFGLALGGALMMKSFAVQDELLELALTSVLLSAILTRLPFERCWSMWPRLVGIAAISGVFLVYMDLRGNSQPGTLLTLITTILLTSAVLLAIYADLSPSKQGEEKQYEV